jgi:hypothetical protein
MGNLQLAAERTTRARHSRAPNYSAIEGPSGRDGARKWTVWTIARGIVMRCTMRAR